MRYSQGRAHALSEVGFSQLPELAFETKIFRNPIFGNWIFRNPIFRYQIFKNGSAAPRDVCRTQRSGASKQAN